MNKKGLTLIELIITIALVSVIMVFLYKLLATVNFESKSDFIDTADRETRVEIIRTIQDELITFNSNKDNTGVYIANILASSNKVEIKAPTASTTKYEIEIPDDLKTLNFYKVTGPDRKLIQSWKLRNGKFEAISDTTCINKDINYAVGVSTQKLNLMECDFKVFTENYNNKISSNGFNSNNTLDDIIITLTNYNEKSREEETVDPDSPTETSRIFKPEDTIITVLEDPGLLNDLIENVREHGDDKTNEYVKFFNDENRVAVGMEAELDSASHPDALKSKYGKIKLILANKKACASDESKRTDCGLIFIGQTTINGNDKVIHTQKNYRDEIEIGAYKQIFTELETIIEYHGLKPEQVNVEYGVYFTETSNENERYGVIENQKIYLLSAVEVTGNIKSGDNYISKYCNTSASTNGICVTGTIHRSLELFDTTDGDDINTWLRDITTIKGTTSTNGWWYEYKNGSTITECKYKSDPKTFVFAFRLM